MQPDVTLSQELFKNKYFLFLTLENNKREFACMKVCLAIDDTLVSEHAFECEFY